MAPSSKPVQMCRSSWPRLTAPERMLAASIDLRPGQEIAPTDLSELLIDAGFTREDPADEQGEFAVRGGIVDIFPAGEAHPVRLEFIGDTIETLRTYDPSTQRSIAPIDQIAIVPLRDTLAKSLSVPNPESRIPTPDKDQWKANPESRIPNPDEDRTATLFDYLSRAKASRIIVSERDEVDASAIRLLEQVQQSYENIVGADLNAGPGRTRGSAPAPSDLFADWAAVESRLAHATELAQLGLDDDATDSVESRIPSPESLPSRPVRCQPAVELKGRLSDWVAEIRRLRDEGETTLFVAATPGRAERTIELLKEYDVFAIPVERAEDARYAAVLVAVGGLSRGFRLPDAGLQIYAEADVFEEERRAPERRRSATKAFLSDLRDLKVGDF